MSLVSSFLHDIKWKQVAISSAIAFLVALACSLLIQYVKEESFVIWFKKHIVGIGPNNVEQTAHKFFNSYYWIPLYILMCFISQGIASIYLARKTKGRELTNGLALGIICMVLVYQFNPILSALGIVFSVATCYMVKHNTMKLKENL